MVKVAGQFHRYLLLALTLGLTPWILAQEVTPLQVEEDPVPESELPHEEDPVTGSQPPPGDQANENALQLATIFRSIGELENEISYLLGRIEELENQLQTLRQESRNRYTEIDQRIRTLSSGDSELRGGFSSLTEDDGTEYGAYSTAMTLIEQGEEMYEEAIMKFEAMIEQYPNGEYIADAYFFLGELFKAIDPPDLEQSRQKYVQLIRLYPDHPKIPDATYKLGTIYAELEDSEKAKEYLEKVINEFPETTPARLAEQYLSILEE